MRKFLIRAEGVHRGRRRDSELEDWRISRDKRGISENLVTVGSLSRYSIGKIL